MTIAKAHLSKTKSLESVLRTIDSLVYCPCRAREIPGFDIRVRFSVVNGRAESSALTSSMSPGGGAYSRAWKTKKS